MAALSSLLREVFPLSDLGAIERVTAETVCVRDGSVLAAISVGQAVAPLYVTKTEHLRLKQPRVQAVRRKGRNR